MVFSQCPQARSLLRPRQGQEQQRKMKGTEEHEKRKRASADPGKRPPGTARSVGTLSLMELGCYRVIHLKRRWERMHHHLLAAGLCSCCSLPLRAASCFILLPSCQCNVQPMHTLCFNIPVMSSFAIPFPGPNCVSPKASPRMLSLPLVSSLHTDIRSLNSPGNSAFFWFTR